MSKEKIKKQERISGKNMREEKKSQSAKKENFEQKSFIDKIDRFYFIYIIGFILAVYIQVINFSYTGFDDDFLVVNNMQQLQTAKFVDVFTGNSFLTDAVSGFYRPLQTITFITDAQIGNGNLWSFHTTNLLLFMLSALILFKVFRKIEFYPLLSLFATLIISLHPLFAINVAWLPARGDLLLAVFGMSSFLYFMRYIETKKVINLFLHILLLLLAFFSKETAILLPVVMYSYFLITRKKIFSSEINILGLIWIVCFAFWYYLRFSFSGSLPENQIFGLTPFIENLRTIPEYISKFIVPFNLMLLPVFSFFTSVLGMIIIILIIFLFLKKWKGIENKEKNFLLFGVLWFVLLVFPGMLYSRYYPKSDMFYHYLDHRAYLPMIGFVIILFLMFKQFLRKTGQRKILMFGITITIILSLYSFVHVKNFSNPTVFLDNAIEDNPKAAVVYFLRGNIFKDAGDFTQAINNFTRAVTIDKNYAEAYNNRGSAYGLLGDYQKSVKDLTKAIKLEPNIPDGYFNRAIARDAIGDYEGAVKDFTKSILMTPNDYLNYYLRGNSYSKLGLKEKAINDFNKAINLYSGFADAYLKRGIERYKSNDKSGACSDWQKAVDLGSEQAKQMINRYCLE